jgi:hypothetical protein
MERGVASDSNFDGAGIEERFTDRRENVILAALLDRQLIVWDEAWVLLRFRIFRRAEFV